MTEEFHKEFEKLQMQLEDKDKRQFTVSRASLELFMKVYYAYFGLREAIQDELKHSDHKGFDF